MRRRSIYGALVFSVAICVAADAQGDGYKVGAESIIGIGRAGAGGAPMAGDASVNHTNPAGIISLAGREFVTGLTYIHPEVDFEPGSSTLFDGSALTGTDGGNAGTPALVPNMHIVIPVNKVLAAGFSITSQYGLVSDYHPNFIDRYELVNASLFGVNFNPSIAWKLSESISIGGGLNIAYGRQKLRQAIDFGSVCAAALGGATCAAGFGLVPGQSDGLARVRLDDWAMGFNLGVNFDISPSTRVGLGYRSKLTFEGRGHAINEVPENALSFLAAAGAPTAFANSDASGKFYFPAHAEMSISHDLNNRLTVGASLNWTDWSIVKETRIRFDNPTAATSVSAANYRDSYRFGAGFEYAASERLTLRGGIAFQKSPIRDEFREPAVPDSDRIITAFGASYDLSDTVSLQTGYQFHKLSDGPQDRVSATGSRSRGNYDVSAHFLAVGIRVKF